MNENSKINDLTEIILKIISERKPKSVKQLVILLKENRNLQEKETLEAISKLQAQGIIRLEDDDTLRPRSFAAYAVNEALWYLLTIVAGAITVTLVFTIPENLYPWVYVRICFGLMFVLFLPGYAFVKALFPTELPAQVSSESLEMIERIALGVGLSIALVSIVGLLLYYSPWGLSLPATVISLFLFTLIFATVAISRESRVSKRA